MEKFVCQKCGKEFDTKQKLGGHSSKCGRINQLIICPICNKLYKGNQALQQHITFQHTEGYVNTNNQLVQNLYCQYCNKSCKNLNSLHQHEIRCKNNPNRINVITSPNFNTIGRKSWNKGLTKETDPRVARNGDSIKKFNINHQRYRTATDDTRIYNDENQIEIQKWITYTKTMTIDLHDYHKSINQEYVQICSDGNVDLEHRYLIRLYTGAESFVVHHLDENKTNNNIKNLIGFKTVADHVRYHYNKNCKLVYDEATHLFEAIIPE